MNRPRIIAALFLCHAAIAQAQQLASRIQRFSEGEMRLTYAARPGVCGDGGTFMGDASAPEGMRIYFSSDEGFWSGMGPDFRGDCVAGPVRVSLFKAAGTITDLRLFVGGVWRGSGQDFGTVAAADAAGYLLELAKTAPERVSGRAILAATLADSVQLAARLGTLARDRTLRTQVRERALRWLPDVAERESAMKAAEQTLRAVAQDQADIASVRERAIRSLPAGDANDGFLRDLYTRLDLRSLRERVVRRLGETPGSANVAWLRARILDQTEALTLKDRAIRVLGEELGERDMLRDLYARVPDTPLRDRMIRVVADQGDEASGRWLRQIVESQTEPSALRERALRMLAERGGTEYIRDAYPKLDVPALKDRAIRLMSEAGSQESRAWLRGIVADESETTELRDRAVRSLAEAGATTDDLIQLYDATKPRAIHERLIRIFAERGDQAALDKLAVIARTDPDESVRRFAVRRLAEKGDPRARQ